MLRYVRWRWKLWQLEGRYLKESEGTEKALADARARGARQAELDGIAGGDVGGVSLYKFRAMQSEYLISEATRLMIPLPDEDDGSLWTVSDEQHEYVLTPKAIKELRAAIRAEKTARMQAFKMWVPGVTGLIGTAIGLASVLLGKGK